MDMLKLFQAKMDDNAKDPLIGSAVAGRYHVRAMVFEDDFSRLYIGTDITDDCTIGVRIAVNAKAHGRMLEWLARAMLTSGKHAILAIGHMEQDKTMYVVLSEAALDIIRQPAKAESQQPYLEYEGA